MNSFSDSQKERAQAMEMRGKKALICGGGGFIGGHLVKSLIADGVDVIRAVDIKPIGEWYQVAPGVENLVLDLQDKVNCYRAARGADLVFQLAADMGGMGFIENNKALCMLSVLINTHMLIAARDSGWRDSFMHLRLVSTTPRSRRVRRSPL
jgi:nucleoside-diphosphate-sugar epimerase